jgi:pectate lyase
MKISVNPGTALSSSDTVWVTYDAEIAKGSFNPSAYYTYKADAVGDVKALVTAYSGVGKIDISDYENGTVITPVVSSSSATEEASSSSEISSSSETALSSSSEEAAFEERGNDSDDETALVKKESSKVNFYVAGNRITFSAQAGAHVQIFSITGKLLKQAVAQNGETSLRLDLPNGQYLFKSGKTLYRFMIR